jgi:hypothetical protein
MKVETINPMNPKELAKRLGGFLQSRAKFVFRLPILYPLGRAVFRLINNVHRKTTRAAETRGEKSVFGKLLFVVPERHVEPLKKWKPGQGNLYFEIAQSAKERYGEASVSVLPLDNNGEQAIDRILLKLRHEQYTHVLMCSEESYGSSGTGLAILARELEQCFSGQVVLFMFDSIYWRHLYLAELFARDYRNTSVICTDNFPRNLSVTRSQGPTLLPISEASIAILMESTASAAANSFVSASLLGQLYGHRGRWLKRARAKGLNVLTNPHSATTGGSAPYMGYAMALHKSWGTINLSQANGAPVKHAKLRLLEAALLGAVVFTDEKILTTELLGEGGFVHFSSQRDLAKQLRHLQGNTEDLETIRQVALKSSLRLRERFWLAFEDLSVQPK